MPPRARLEPVHDEILARRRAGETLEEIGDRFGVSRERIRQICAAAGVGRPLTDVHYRRFFSTVGKVARKQARAANGGSLSQHGGNGARYTMGCRCPACTKANTRRIRAMFGKQPPAHGTTHAYHVYGCRCAQCKVAGSASNRVQRLRRRTRALIASGEIE